jgi:peroxiredoxin
MTTETNPSIGVGAEAPDFELRDTDGNAVKLSDFRGTKNVLILFYPFAFSPTCHAEFCQLRDTNADLVSDENLEVLGISADPLWTLKAWKQQEGFVNRFLSDYWPHGEVSRAYASLNEKTGGSKRNTFLIDKQGIVRFAEIDLPPGPRDQDGWRKAIAELD